MPRLYAYPATLSRSVAARATEREPNALYGREVYTKRHFASHRAPRHAASRRVAFPVRRPAQCPRRAVLRRTPPRVSREGALPTRREVPFAVQLHVPFTRDRLASLVPVRADFYSSFSFFIPFSFFFFLPPVSFPSRLCSPRRVSSNAIMLGLVRLGSFVFSPALLGFCYWTDLSVSYNDYCYRSLGI